MKLNKKAEIEKDLTHEGTVVRKLTPLQELTRTVLSCLLWEDTFYESGTSVADRIKALVPYVPPTEVAKLAMKARTEMKLRHVPLLLVSEMSRYPAYRKYVRGTLSSVIQRADELPEFLAIYWQGKTRQSRKLAKGAFKGLRDAFTKFSEYDLAKYRGDDKDIKLSDVLRLIRPKPANADQSALWKRLRRNELKTPDTWEVGISATKDKKAEWTRLLTEKKLGGLAFLRNLRNLTEAGVDPELIKARFDGPFERVLPFRFITAARYAVRYEPQIEAAMLRCLAGMPKLPGKTALIIDTSPSMWMAKVSAKSELDRFDAAAALAILARELCEDIQVWAFNHTYYEVPARHGFALRDALAATKGEASCGAAAVTEANKAGYDRIIVLTDGQWHNYDPIRRNYIGHAVTDGIKLAPAPLTKKAYMINVSIAKNGVGYGPWISIDGWSESVLDYIHQSEAQGDLQ